MNWIYFASLSAVCAGLIPILAKRGLSHVDSTLASALPAVVMAASLALVAACFGRVREIPTLDRATLSSILLCGLVSAASWTFYLLALRNGPASKVVTIDRTSAAFTLLLAALFLGETLTWQRMVGVGMVLAGVFITIRH